MQLYDTRDLMIQDLIKPGARICEVGVWCGEFSRKLWMLRPTELVLIDPWEGMVPSGDCNGNNVRYAELPKVYELLKKEVVGKPIKLERGLSWDILEKYPDEYFDMLYLDSSHSYEGTKRELVLALKKVKKGGWIMAHDYEVNKVKCMNEYNFGVKEAIDEFCRDFFYKINCKALDGCVSVGIRV